MFEDKAVIVFDLDGTLVDIELDWNAIMKKLVDSFPEVGVTPADSHTAMITEKIARALGHEHKRKAYEMIRDFEKGCGMTPIETTIAIAEEMKGKGKKLAVLSNNCHETIAECLERAGILDIFDFIVGKEDVEKHKPNPEGINKTIKHFGVSRDKVAFVGNEKVDADAAKAAGVEFFMV